MPKRSDYGSVAEGMKIVDDYEYGSEDDENGSMVNLQEKSHRTSRTNESGAEILAGLPK